MDYNDSNHTFNMFLGDIEEHPESVRRSPESAATKCGARSAFNVAQIPFRSCVEIELVAELG